MKLKALLLVVPMTAAIPVFAGASPAEASTSTAAVTYVYDGDTVKLANGEKVRLIGIDTPERGQCGYTQATNLMKRLVLGDRVTLTTGARDNRDRYGRLLRYVNRGVVDAGRRMLASGWARARYDSSDGYGWHPREADYHRVDANNPFPGCRTPAPTPPPSGNCHPSYPTVCLPLNHDVDCGEIPYRNFKVLEPDPYNLDGVGYRDDGIGCET
jgi:endonuclease YncB( thermonuclease family)